MMIKFLYNLFFNRSQFKLGETTEPKRPEFSSIPAVPSLSFGGKTVIRPLPDSRSESTLNENMTLTELKKKVEGNMKIYITVEDILTSSGKYPERAKHPECTNEVKTNAAKLCDQVNNLLTGIKWSKAISITSGFRPSEINAGIGNAAKKSNHMLGKALDILDDKDQTLVKVCSKEILEKYNLYREDGDYTKGKNTNWCHLQFQPTKSGKRIFKP